LFQKKKNRKFIIIQKIIEHFIVNLRTKEAKIGEYYLFIYLFIIYLFIYFLSFNSLFLTDQTKIISTFILKVYSYEIISIFFKKKVFIILFYFILFYFILIRIFEPILNETIITLKKNRFPIKETNDQDISIRNRVTKIKMKFFFLNLFFYFVLFFNLFLF